MDNTTFVISRGENGLALQSEFVLFEHTPHSFTTSISIRMQHNEGGYRFRGEEHMMEDVIRHMAEEARRVFPRRVYLRILNTLKKRDDRDGDRH